MPEKQKNQSETNNAKPLASWNCRYPVPFFRQEQEAESPELMAPPELELGKDFMLLDDGRPARLEHWYDCEMACFFLTAIYSDRDLDAWQEEDHFAYLQRNGLLEGRTSERRGVGLNTRTDAAGNRFIVATILMGEG